MSDSRRKVDASRIERLKRRYERERQARLAAEEIAERFTRDALHDPLTGLPNRALFLDRLGQACQHGSRDGGTLVVVMVDIDDFKDINDTYGHDAGDEYLCEAARRLLDAVRPEDTVARMGGDEFAIIVVDIEPSDLDALADRLQGSLARDYELGGVAVGISASIGLALKKDGDVDAEALLRQADLAMYKAKRDGKAGFSLFETGMHRAMLAEKNDRTDLLHALRDGDIELELEAVDGEYHVSVSWDRDEQTRLDVMALTMYAGELGLQTRFGWWVIDTACRRFAERLHGADNEADTLVLRLSYGLVSAVRTPQVISGAIEDHELTVERLCIELCAFGQSVGDRELASALGTLIRSGFRVRLDQGGRDPLYLTGG